MIMSKEKLLFESERAGFRAEILEKVVLLVDLLNDIKKNANISNKVVLKGGTALNLFYFDLPRLSIDIDLNYIAHVDRAKMLLDRAIVVDDIVSMCERKGFSIRRNPSRHAGGKMVMTYPSALGYKGLLEVDLNFMHRMPLLPLSIKDTCLIGGYQAEGISLLDIHELAAGKLAALFARTKSRDLFDSHYLFTQCDLNNPLLRTMFLVYGAMAKNDWRLISPKNIRFDSKDFQNKLIPVLKRDNILKGRALHEYGGNMIEEIQKHLQRLLPFMENEIEFLDRLLDYGEIVPSIICEDEKLCEKIKLHPGLHWQAKQAKAK